MNTNVLSRSTGFTYFERLSQRRFEENYHADTRSEHGEETVVFLVENGRCNGYTADALDFPILVFLFSSICYYFDLIFRLSTAASLYS